MTKARREEINNLTKEIRKILNLKTPIDIDDVIENILGGQMELVDNLEDGVEAKIAKIDGDSFKISIDDSYHENRLQFTKAHELGHLFLHMGFLVNEDKWNNIENYEDSIYARKGRTEEEYEAHEFSASFLMPEDEFRTKVKEYSKGKICNVKKVAKYFAVSTEAVRNRGRWLGIFKW